VRGDIFSVVGRLAGSGVPVAFDTIDFDYTGNVTNQTTFTLQASGEYAFFGSVNWVGADTGEARTITVFQNGSPIYTASIDPTFTAPFDLTFSGYGSFSVGDVVQVVATHSFATQETIGAGSYFSMILTGPQEPPLQVPPDSTDSTQPFTADTTMASLTAVYVKPDGDVTFVDPTVVNMSATVPPTVLFPFVDGITLSSVTVGNAVECGCKYGGVYQPAGASFTVGGLLYVGPNGVLTQNYATLITEVQWVICVGRAISTTSFLYEPHLPQRLLMLE
jgi:hypothetical protein